MKGFKTNLTSTLFGIRNALGVPALLLFSAMTGFGSLAQEQGLSLWISMLSTVLIWGMPGQVVHVELYGLGAPLIAVALGVAGANARFLPMTLSMMPLLRKAPHHRRWNYLLVHMISINTWAEMMRKGDEIPVERRVAYFSWLFVDLHVCRSFGSDTGVFAPGKHAQAGIALSAVSGSHLFCTDHVQHHPPPFFAGICLRLPVGSDFSSMDSGMGFGNQWNHCRNDCLFAQEPHPLC